jgi:metallo-beta-lactamase class B
MTSTYLGATLAVAVAALGLSGSVVGQPAPTGPASYPAQTVFPKEDRAAVARHLLAAQRIAAGDADLTIAFNWRCLTSPLDRTLVNGVQHDGLVPAARIFDNLYSIGQNAVSAWAIDTSDGIVIIDALNNEAEARDILVPNLRAVGLDPARIKYLVITHGHGDHFGGAKYLQDRFGAKVVSSAADWAMMESPGRGGGPFADLVPPRRDIVVSDGQTIKVGNTDIRFHVTPGHTPGTLSLMFSVFDKGQRHMAGLMGGTGGGQTPDTVRKQIVSLARWEGLARAAGVDVLLTNHPSHMGSTERVALLRYGAIQGNPFVYGAARYGRYMQVMRECSRVQLARMGEKAD